MKKYFLFLQILLLGCFNLLDGAAPGPRVPGSYARIPHSGSGNAVMHRAASSGSIKRSPSSGSIKRKPSSGSINRKFSSGSLCDSSMPSSYISSIEPVGDLTSLRGLVEGLFQSESEMENTLFVLDMHGTLVFSKKSACLQLRNIRTFEDYLHSYYDNRLQGLELFESEEDFFSKIFVVTGNQDVLVDDGILEIMSILNGRNCKVLVVSGSNYEQLGVIDSLADFRISTLRSLGFSIRSNVFEDAANRCGFDGVDNRPLYKDSFLFCHKKLEKSKLLISLFEQANWFPKRIVWLEDDIEVLETARGDFGRCKEFVDSDGRFVGFHYCAIMKFMREYNPVLAQGQVDFFLHRFAIEMEEAPKDFSGSKVELFYSIIEKCKAEGKKLWRDDETSVEVVDGKHCCVSNVCTLL